jgi:predicted nucleotidyltransferase
MMNASRTLTAKHAAALGVFAGAARRLFGDSLVTLKLFGSHARGEATPHSDLDVLVLVEQASPDLKNQVLDLAFEVNLAHDVYISPRVIARRIFEDPVWRSTSFIRALEAEGALCEARDRRPGPTPGGASARNACRGSATNGLEVRPSEGR